MITSLDFCRGAGGLTRGLLDAGINVVAGIDLDGRCRDTYERNNKPSVFHQADVKTIDYKFIRQLIRGVPKKDLLIFYSRIGHCDFHADTLRVRRIRHDPCKLQPVYCT